MSIVYRIILVVVVEAVEKVQNPGNRPGGRDLGPGRKAQETLSGSEKNTASWGKGSFGREGKNMGKRMWKTGGKRGLVLHRNPQCRPAEMSLHKAVCTGGKNCAKPHWPRALMLEVMSRTAAATSGSERTRSSTLRMEERTVV